MCIQDAANALEIAAVLWGTRGAPRSATPPDDDDAGQMMATLGDLRRNYRYYKTATQFKMIYGADCPDAANPQLHDTPAHPHFQTDVWFSFSHVFQLIKLRVEEVVQQHCSFNTEVQKCFKN